MRCLILMRNFVEGYQQARGHCNGTCVQRAHTQVSAVASGVLVQVACHGHSCLTHRLRVTSIT